MRDRTLTRQIKATFPGKSIRERSFPEGRRG